MSGSEETLKSIQRQLISIDDRLRVLEAKTLKNTFSDHKPRPAVDTSVLVQPAVSSAPQSASSGPANFTTVNAAEFNQATEPYFSTPSKPVDSSTFLGVVGIFFVILAGVFFIRMTIESGVLTPQIQVLLGLGTGLVLYFIPLVMKDSDQRYGGLLAGAGVAILHLTWLGGYTVHHLLSETTTLVCATIIGVLTVISKRNEKAPATALVAMFGTYLAAPVVGFHSPDFSTVAVFLLIWNLSFTVSGIVVGRRELLFLATYMGTLSVLILTMDIKSEAQYFELLQLQIVQFFIFTFGQIAFSYNEDRVMSEKESQGIFPALILWTAASHVLVSKLYPDWSDWFGLVVGVLVLIVYGSAKALMKTKLESANSLISFATLAIVYSLFFRICPMNLKPLFGFIAGVGVLLVWKVNPRFREDFFWPGMIILSTFLMGAVLTINHESGQDFMVYNFLYGAACLAAMTFRDDKAKSTLGSILLPFAHVEIMLGMYRLVDSSNGGALMLTLLWGAYALIVLGLAYWRRDSTIGNSALLILLVVSGKALLFDMAKAENILRIICLFLEGMLLYGCGLVFKRFKEWES